MPASSFEAVADLQKRLAFIDLQLRHGGAELRFLVAKLQDIKVKMYQEAGHAVPHVHIDYGGRSHIASYAIESGQRLAGNLHREYDKAVTRWIDQNRDWLLQLWNTTQSGGDPHLMLAEIKGNV